MVYNMVSRHLVSTGNTVVIGHIGSGSGSLVSFHLKTYGLVIRGESNQWSKLLPPRHGL